MSERWLVSYMYQHRHRYNDGRLAPKMRETIQTAIIHRHPALFVLDHYRRVAQWQRREPIEDLDDCDELVLLHAMPLPADYPTDDEAEEMTMTVYAY